MAAGPLGKLTRRRRLYVFDNQIARIFVVGPDGALVREIGRRGEGPGEFRSAEDMMVMEDRRVVVLDVGHLAYQVFDANGDFQRMVREWIEETQFFDEVPVIRGLQTSWNGRIRVQRRGELPASDDGPVDVLDSEGRYLGSYREGATAIPSAFGPNGLAAFLETDEYGVATVVVKRLSPEVR